MSILAATGGHRGLLWGIALVVIGVLHMSFRGFYARREHAIHDARQDTAPALTKPFYRRHSSGWYSRNTVWFGALMVVVGLIEVALNA